MDFSARDKYDTRQTGGNPRGEMNTLHPLPSTLPPNAPIDQGWRITCTGAKDQAFPAGLATVRLSGKCDKIRYFLDFGFILRSSSLRFIDPLMRSPIDQ